jgi:hypothetical protein
MVGPQQREPEPLPAAGQRGQQPPVEEAVQERRAPVPVPVDDEAVQPGRRRGADITLFKSLGIALEDIAFADLIWRRAIERGVGKPMP